MGELDSALRPPKSRQILLIVSGPDVNSGSSPLGWNGPGPGSPWLLLALRVKLVGGRVGVQQGRPYTLSAMVQLEGPELTHQGNDDPLLQMC